MTDYPKMLHKYGGLELMVASKADESDALKDGWSVDPVKTVMEKQGVKIDVYSKLAVEAALKDGYALVPAVGGKK